MGGEGEVCGIIEIGHAYDGSHIPSKILENNWFYPYFKDCVWTIDCTHVHVKVQLTEASRYRGRKDFPTQNVFPIWEDTASDSFSFTFFPINVSNNFFIYR